MLADETIRLSPCRFDFAAGLQRHASIAPGCAEGSPQADHASRNADRASRRRVEITELWISGISRLRRWACRVGNGPIARAGSAFRRSGDHARSATLQVEHLLVGKFRPLLDEIEAHFRLVAHE